MTIKGKIIITLCVLIIAFSIGFTVKTFAAGIVPPIITDVFLAVVGLLLTYYLYQILE